MARQGTTGDQFPRKFGKYHLLAPLAQGGMGALYVAVTGDKGFERFLCIKTVLPHLADKEYVARFRDEAKIVVRLSHGNLIPVFDAGQVGGELFLAMDFVKGKDLRAVWNRCAKKAVAFPIDVAVYITKELCRGLGYAHGFGSINLVHRDVSPPNVLVSYSGEVKLTDFGLASSTLKMEKTVPGIIYGKVAYMSPEQARGEKLDGRSDIHASGIILWELLTGRQLFPPGTEQPTDLLKRAGDPSVVPPSERAPRVPVELDAIVLKALANDRDERYGTAEEFRDALGAWLAANHPSTDANRVERFISELFEEDIVREEEERLALIQKTRERVMTLPPTDELRRLLEEAGDGVRESIEKASDRRRESEGPNHGRRAPDRGDDELDRRGAGGRRLVDAIDHTKRGVAVDVPRAGPGGATFIADAATQSGTVAALDPADDSGEIDVIGQVLENRYRVDRLIGEGGMGRVYLAEHVDIGKKFAVKVLHPVYGRMPDLVERFRREARAASRIGHPNIVDVTDSGTTDDGSVYFVMEYLEGVELAGVIDREGAIDIRRALDISTQVCRALSAAHAVGIIHRDLKPENIFLTAREGTSDFVKVLDFGIAKSSEAEEARVKKLTSPGMAMGTPEYMAPEQAAGKPADERCDVYALGAILYEMLTGSAPYEGANFMEILTRKATLEPTPPRQLRSEIPEPVEELLMRAMARNAEERPPSMEAFEYELTKCFAGRGAAVANILGISQDENFDSTTRSTTRSGADNPFHRENTGSGRAPSRTQQAQQPAVATPPLAPTPPPAATPTPPPLDDGSLDLPVPSVSGGGLRALGWFLFLALLVAGGAAVLYVAKGEGTAQRVQQSEDEASAEPGRVQPEEVAVPTQPTPTTPVEPADPAEPATVVSDGGVASAADATPETPLSTAETSAEEGKNGGKAANRGRRRNKTRTGPPRSSREARRLLSEARGHVANMDWEQARQKYQRVVSGRFRQQRGYLGLADVAFQTKNAELAIKYAKKAGKSTKARMALGNAYFKKGDYKSALDIYNGVLAKSPGHKEAQRSAKVSRQRLGK